MSRNVILCVVMVTAGLLIAATITTLGILWSQNLQPTEARNSSHFFDEEAHLAICGPKSPKASSKCSHPGIDSIVDEAEIKQLNFQSEKEISEDGHWGGVRPLRYDLDLNFSDRFLYKGAVKILLKAVNRTSTFYVNANAKDNVLSVKYHSARLTERCSQVPICINRVKVLRLLDIAAFQLQTTLTPGKFYILEIPYFVGNVKAKYPKHGLFSSGVHAPSIPNQPWASGTIFQMRRARTTFPCMDHPSLKAKFRLCIKHQSNLTALSNTQVDTVTSERNRTQTCFEKTPVLPTYVVTFSLATNIESVKSDASDDLPEIEVFTPNRFTNSTKWIISETKIATKAMQTITNSLFPLKRLAFINMGQSPFWGIENSGLVTLDFGWTQYSSEELGHKIVVHEIIHQWVGNLFTISYWDEICLQEGLTTYLEWFISAKLPSVKTTISDEIRDNIAKALAWDNGVDPVVRYFNTTQDIAERCFQKPPVIFHLLSEAFGQEKLWQFVAKMVERFSYRTASIDDWAATMQMVTGSSASSQMLRQWFTKPGFPVLIVRKPNKKVISVRQLIYRNGEVIDQDHANKSQDVFPLPLIVKKNGSNATQHLLMTNSVVHFWQNASNSQTENNWFVLDPEGISYSRQLYEMSNYRAILSSCFPQNSTVKAKRDHCELPPSRLNSIFDDFCMGLLANQMPIDTNDKKEDARWVLDKLADLTALRGRGQKMITVRRQCICCFKSKKEMDNEHPTPWNPGCGYTWNKNCRNLRIMRMLGRDFAVNSRERVGTRA